jgi:hypothetical protein
MLGACDRKDDKDSLARLDAELANSTADPALKGALEDQIVVDPNLTGQSNANALRPAGRPLDGGLPAFKVDPKAVAAQIAAAEKLAGGKLLRAPEAIQTPSDGETPATLGALARDQGKRQGIACDGKLDYGMEWAQRLPEALPLYPGARLTDAAGAEGKSCAIRAVSFLTGVPMQNLLDFYYTQAKRAGYAASHEIMDGQHMLGGVRGADEAAYVLTFAPAPGGATAVDLIANKGR